MSWLVAACFPGLLMLSTYGLQRLESAMNSAGPAAAGTVPRLHRVVHANGLQAVPGHASDLPEVATDTAPGHRLLAEEPGLPTRLCSLPKANRQFQPTGFSNPV
ncbi:MAG: hypothetical protein WD228_04935 [Mycobacterium sp.]